MPDPEFEILHSKTQEHGLTVLFSHLTDDQIDIPLQIVVTAAFN